MIELTSSPIFPEPIVSRLRNDACGAIVTFVGTVRNSTQGKKVAFLEIKPCGENAEIELGKIASEIGKRWQLQNVAICRRIGKLKVGEIALVIAIASPHREEAFEACRYAVDSIKRGGITTEKEIYEFNEG